MNKVFALLVVLAFVSGSALAARGGAPSPAPGGPRTGGDPAPTGPRAAAVAKAHDGSSGHNFDGSGHRIEDGYGRTVR